MLLVLAFGCRIPLLKALGLYSSLRRLSWYTENSVALTVAIGHHVASCGIIMWYGLESTIGGSDNTCPPEKTLGQAVRQQCELPQRGQDHKRLPARDRREVVHGVRRYAKDQPWTGET